MIRLPKNEPSGPIKLNAMSAAIIEDLLRDDLIRETSNAIDSAGW